MAAVSMQGRLTAQGLQEYHFSIDPFPVRIDYFGLPDDEVILQQPAEIQDFSLCDIDPGKLLLLYAMH